jgi:hypothetical protein
MERLKWSTETSLKRKIEFKAVVMKEEMDNNQQVLASLKYIQPKEDPLLQAKLERKKLNNDLLVHFSNVRLASCQFQVSPRLPSTSMYGLS